MATGLIALLDDVATLARVAAASLDDVVGQAAKAGTKAAGVVIDDSAVTPQYVVGFAAERELPIVARIAAGSMKNKLLILLPAALLLSWLAPVLITPLLTIGGLFLCYEGAEKVYEALFPHAAHEHEAIVHGHDPAEVETIDPKVLEDAQVSGAIKTDFILSAEIMAITLASIPDGSFWMRAVVLAIVAIAITVGVYGVVALIVKADDFGVYLARNDARSIVGATSRGVGRGLVLGMPLFLKALSVVGTVAMIWVGGGIVVHGLAWAGLAQPEHAIHAAAVAAGAAVPAATAFVEWLVGALGASVLGLMAGAVVIPLVSHVIAPAWVRLKRLRQSAPA